GDPGGGCAGPPGDPMDGRSRRFRPADDLRSEGRSLAEERRAIQQSAADQPVLQSLAGVSRKGGGDRPPPCPRGADRKRITMAGRTRWAAWLAAAAVAFGLVGGSTCVGAADSERLRVGLTHTPGAGAFFIAAERYFAGQGLEARIEFLP